MLALFSALHWLTPTSKQWRRDHPFGFYAKPARTKEGVLDLKNWECGVPGKDKTMWEGGLFKLTIAFPDGEYRKPAMAPVRLSADANLDG